MRCLALFVACSTTALALAAAPLGGQQTPTFRAAIDIVDVDVSVIDGNRLPVRGLTADDFTVLEDGKPRPVVAFTHVDLPSREAPTAPWMAEVAPDVISNVVPREGRLIAILIDRSIPIEHLLVAQQFAEASVDQLRPGDLAAVAFSTFGVPQNFTADRARLLAAIRQPMVGLPQGGDMGETQCYCGICTLDSIGRIAEAMQDVRQRRKMLVVIGTRMPIESPGRCSGILTPSRRRVMSALEAGNVTVHVFDPTGLETLAPSASQAGGSASLNRAAHLRRIGDLRVLPEHTGGRVIANPIRPADRVAELYRESDSYYVLGFQPLVADGRARRHDIRVTVNRKDVTVQARRGYYSRGPDQPDEPSLPGTLPAALRSAISGLWPRNDLTLAMTMSPLATPDLQAGIVAVTLQVTQEFAEVAAASDFEQRAGTGPGRETHVNVLVGAFDRNGRALAFDRQALAVTPRRLTDRRFAYQVPMYLDLKPGRYEIRAAVEDATLSRSGSVYGDVDVPDFRRQPVSMSGVFLDVSPSLPAPASAPRRGLVPITASVRRQFDRTDTVTGFIRLYHGLTRFAAPGYLVSQIRDDRDRIVFRQESRLVAEHMGAGRATDLSLDVPVSRLEPGAYVLMVEARHGSDTASRQVRFDVR